jgi:hypothetical protein
MRHAQGHFSRHPPRFRALAEFRLRSALISPPTVESSEDWKKRPGKCFPDEVSFDLPASAHAQALQLIPT